MPIRRQIETFAEPAATLHNRLNPRQQSHCNQLTQADTGTGVRSKATLHIASRICVVESPTPFPCLRHS